ncbi:MAG: type 4a pilus biogenesis protein PilO [Candidatus Methylomirabilales bacterium]
MRRIALTCSRAALYTLVAAGLILVVNLGVGVFVTLPLFRDVGSQGERLLSLETRTQSLRRDYRQRAMFLKAAERIAQYRQGIPPPGAIVSMIRRITNLGSKLSLEVVNGAYRPVEVREDDLLRLSFQMDIEGSYAGVRRFLYEIEGLPEPLAIERLTITDAARSRKAEQLRLRLEMASYFHRVEVTAGAQARPAKEVQ